MKRLLFAAVAICATFPAVAADLPSAAPPPEPPPPLAYDWTGAYVGGHFGWAWGHNDFSVTNSLTGAFVRSGADNGASFYGGGQIGYDFMMPSRIVLGAQTSVSWGSSTSSTTSVSTPAGVNVSSTSSTGEMSGNVTARLGYAMGDFLPFATGGWAWMTGTNTRTQLVGTTGLATPGTSDQANIYRNGWTLGAGLEYRFWGNWNVFGVYHYTSYGSINVAYPLAQRTTASSLSSNAVALGVNYKF